MSDLIKINNMYLQIKELNCKRVVSFKDIDRLHERVAGTANKRFLDNQKYFIKNIDYFELTGNRLKEIKRLPNFGIGLKASKAIFITESGYLMLVKSLTDNLAWKIQRELVNNYFGSNKLQKLSPMNQLRLQYEVLEDHEEKLSSIETKVSKLENYMTVDYNQQLVLQELAKIRVVQEMGGKESYCYKNRSLRSKVFARIWRDFKNYLSVNSYRNTAKKDFDRAKKYLREWKVEGRLLGEIRKSKI